MSWKLVLAGLTLGVAALGCQRQCFLSESDFRDAHGRTIPFDLPCNPELSTVPTRGALPPPTTVDEIQREARYLSLREAIATALENGTVGSQSPLTPGLASDALGGFAGIGVQSADAIRVLA